MSNRDDDFLFEDDDDFFQDDDDFGFDDDLSDIEDIDSFDDLSDDEFALEEERQGPNRAFVILAGLMILLFLAGLGVIIFLALQGDETDDFIEQTRVAIVATNEAVETALFLTQDAATESAIGTLTQAPIDEDNTATAVVVQGTETQEAALALTDAFIVGITQTFEAEPSPTPNPLQLTQTQEALDAQATEAPVETDAVGPVETEPVDETPISPGTIEVGDVALTATEIARRLREPIVETPEPGEGGPVDDFDEPTPIVQQPGVDPDQLPDTGLFDDLNGGQGFGALLLIATGLVGVIFGARRLRGINNRRQDE